MRKDFYSGSGKLIGYTVESGSVVNGVRLDCYNGDGAYLGYVDDSGTFDETGYQASMQRVPGGTVPIIQER